MHVTRVAEAPEYQSPGHSRMTMLRLQGKEAGPADTMWLALSTIEPGGGITLSASGAEKFYVVVEGEVDIANGTETHHLGLFDSCRIAPNEPRMIHNAGPAVARLLLAMAQA
jgi:glyoxylate utilization-related uncharacterized protein